MGACSQLLWGKSYTVGILECYTMLLLLTLLAELQAISLQYEVLRIRQHAYYIIFTAR